MSAILKSVIPKTGREVSRLGFGSYRVSKPNHAKALITALEGGINIIDSGNNFENGASETLIGNTLDSLIKSNKIAREDITLVTKGGYLNVNEIKDFNEKADYVKLSDKLYHSVHPKVLEKQLETSLQRLKTNKIDIFMINSPERMLMAKNRSYTAKHLYKDLTESFSYLDGLVKSGVIGGYGICSNTMAFPNAMDHISFSEIIKSCSKPENLVAAQVPFNLFEKESIISTDNDQLKSVADIAKENDIYMMTNRPLTAIANGQIRQLVNHELGDNGSGPVEQQIMEKMQVSFERVTKLESEIMSELPAEDEILNSKFVWGQVLSENLARLAQNHFATRHYLSQQVLPVVQKDLEFLQGLVDQFDAEEDKEAFGYWIESYRESVNDLSKAIIDYAYIDTLRKNNDLDRVLNALCPDLNTVPEDAHSPLSIKALRFLLSHPQVGTVFTGMREENYAKDGLFAAAQQSLDQEDLDDVWRCPIFI